MNINTIITVSIYCLFFIGLIIGTLIGLKRGLRKSSLRLGSLALFLIIAGFITYPISKALLTINISSLNISIGGQIVSSIPKMIKTALFSINGFQEAAESIPSIITLVEGLPIALMNVIVFTLLVFVMTLLSWILYVILSHTLLKETKLERQIKKQKKLDKKKKEEKETPLLPGQKPRAIPLGPPKKHRLWGGVIGGIQAFLLMFLILIPVTSLAGSFGEVMSNPDVENRSNLVVYADEGKELLSEYASDIVTTLIGDEVVSYFETFNNSIPTKILSLGGFNNVIFDAFSTVNINGQGVSIRKDAVALTKIYDNYMLSVDEVGINETWSKMDFRIVRRTVDLLFQTGIFNAFGEEVIPYALDFVLDSDMFNEFDYIDEVKDGFSIILSEYKENPSGFVLGFKEDITVLLNVIESALESGLVDEAISSISAYDHLIAAVKKNDYKFLRSFSNEFFDASLFRVFTSSGLNILLDITEESLSNENYIANLGRVNYDSVDWTLMKPSLFDTIKNLIDIYDIINLYNLNSLFTSPLSVFEDMANEDISVIIPLVGKEIDLVKNSPLFIGQKNNPVQGTALWLGQLSITKDFIDSPEMINLNSWQDELTILSDSVIGLKDSAILSLLVEKKQINLEKVFDNLLEKVSEEEGSETYISTVLKPLLSSTIGKKPIIYALNQITLILEDSTNLSLIEFKKEDLTPDQNNDLISVTENFLKCFSIFSSDTELDLETLDSEKIAELLTALQSNAFKKGSEKEANNTDVNLENKTVTGGGMFSNYYISLVTYVVSDETSINYKTINWFDFFESAKALGSSINDIIENGNIESLINLGDEELEDTLTTLLDSLGLDTTIVEDLSTVKGAIDELKDGEELSSEKKEELFEIINISIDRLLNSTNEEGKNTVETIIDMIQTFTEGELSDQISTTALSNEQTVSNRLRITSLNHSNTIDYASTDSDSVHTDLKVFEATLQDLTCGGVYILQQAVMSGTRILVENITIEDLTTKIYTKTSDEIIKNTLLSLFYTVD